MPSLTSPVRTVDYRRMRGSLKVGDEFRFDYVVGDNKTVPHLYPESEEFQQIPSIFATGFMVGLLEWCCILALKPHMAAGEISVGTYIETTHSAPTPPGMKVTVLARCKTIKSANSIFFEVEAHDQADPIATGVHGRHIVNKERFLQRITEKAALLSPRS